MTNKIEDLNLSHSEINDLQDWLNRTDVGVDINRPQNTDGISILQMCGIDHLENAWSDIYAYFLDPNKDHGLGSLFLTTLLRLTGVQDYVIEDIRIIREYKCKNNKRIDILIRGVEWAIMIENKVYHEIANPFDTYWTSVYACKKRGVLLTLHPVNSPDSRFANVTHIQWLREIKRNLPGQLPVKTDILLNDFIENVNKLTGEMNENIRNYYLANRQKINRLVEVSKEYKKWLEDIFAEDHFIKSLPLGSLASNRNQHFIRTHQARFGSKGRYVMYLIPDTDELVFTVYFERLWKSKEESAYLSVYIEPLNKWYRRIADQKNDGDNLLMRKIKDCAASYGVSGNSPELNFWHCAKVEKKFIINELTHTKIRDFIREVLHPDSNLVKAAKGIVDIMSK